MTRDRAAYERDRRARHRAEATAVTADTRSDGSGWFTLGCVAVVSAACAFVVALGGCAPGTAGEVCNEPDAADCPSHTGGEAGP